MAGRQAGRKAGRRLRCQGNFYADPDDPQYTTAFVRPAAVSTGVTEKKEKKPALVTRNNYASDLYDDFMTKGIYRKNNIDEQILAVKLFMIPWRFNLQ